MLVVAPQPALALLAPRPAGLITKEALAKRKYRELGAVVSRVLRRASAARAAAVLAVTERDVAAGQLAAAADRVDLLEEEVHLVGCIARKASEQRDAAVAELRESRRRMAACNVPLQQPQHGSRPLAIIAAAKGKQAAVQSEYDPEWPAQRDRFIENNAKRREREAEAAVQAKDKLARCTYYRHELGSRVEIDKPAGGWTRATITHIGSGRAIQLKPLGEDEEVAAAEGEGGGEEQVAGPASPSSRCSSPRLTESDSSDSDSEEVPMTPSDIANARSPSPARSPWSPSLVSAKL